MIKQCQWRNDLVSVDSTDVVEMFERLTGKERKNVYCLELKKAAIILVNETTARFKSKVRKNKNKEYVLRRKSGRVVLKNRRIAAVKINRKKYEAKVHIMEDYKTKWFEMGTRSRRTKGHRNVGYYRLKPGGRKYALRIGKPGNRGQIQPGYFFRDAQRAKEREIFDSIETNLSKAILKMANKKAR